MEAIAIFLHHYQGYDLEKALHTKAITFYTLLEWALRVQARETLRAMDAAVYPHMQPAQSKNLRRQYQIAGDTMKAQARSLPDVETEKANIQRIKKLMGQT